MQKKLIAAAVAGVLAAPVIAQAQSTVQIYGVAEWEYGVIDQGNGRPRVDYNESTGSYLGFKGEESLGGGLSAWFQCETTMDIRAFDQVGLCSRNSGLGLKGGFGNVWGGRWHTPFSRIYDFAQVGSETTGILGVARIHGNSGSTSFADNGGNGGSYARSQFRRRETCLTTYETPRMGGFMLGVAASCGNAASDGHTTTPTGGTASAATDLGANKKPRVYSIAGTYAQGPLQVGLGYQRHVNVGPYNIAAAAELTDRAWGASARYTFGPVVAAMTYMDRKWETTATTDLKNRTWTLGAEWTIAGPHELHAYYGRTNDASGSGIATGVAGNGGITAGATTNDTGYNVWSLAYKYSFSKRTSAKFGYVRYDNDTNSSAVRPYNAAALIGNGQATDAWALVVKHRF